MHFSLDIQCNDHRETVCSVENSIIWAADAVDHFLRDASDRGLGPGFAAYVRLRSALVKAVLHAL